MDPIDPAKLQKALRLLAIIEAQEAAAASNNLPAATGSQSTPLPAADAAPHAHPSSAADAAFHPSNPFSAPAPPTTPSFASDVASRFLGSPAADAATRAAPPSAADAASLSSTSRAGAPLSWAEEMDDVSPVMPPRQQESLFEAFAPATGAPLLELAPMKIREAREEYIRSLTTTSVVASDVVRAAFATPTRPCDNAGCGGMHILEDCPLPQRCSGCAGQGHTSFTCRARCTRCASPGHVANRCVVTSVRRNGVRITLGTPPATPQPIRRHPNEPRRTVAPLLDRLIAEIQRRRAAAMPTPAAAAASSSSSTGWDATPAARLTWEGRPVADATQPSSIDSLFAAGVAHPTPHPPTSGSRPAGVPALPSSPFAAGPARQTPRPTFLTQRAGVPASSSSSFAAGAARQNPRPPAFIYEQAGLPAPSSTSSHVPAGPRTEFPQHYLQGQLAEPRAPSSLPSFGLGEANLPSQRPTAVGTAPSPAVGSAPSLAVGTASSSAVGTAPTPVRGALFPAASKEYATAASQAPPPGSQENVKPRVLSPPRIQTYPQPRRCPLCGEMTTHMASNCPKRKCQLCKRSGCMQPKHANPSQCPEWICKRCGGQGHDASQCPDVPKARGPREPPKNPAADLGQWSGAVARIAGDDAQRKKNKDAADVARHEAGETVGMPDMQVTHRQTDDSSGQRRIVGTHRSQVPGSSSSRPLAPRSKSADATAAGAASSSSSSRPVAPNLTSANAGAAGAKESTDIEAKGKGGGVDRR
ncbi:MAG: hypothetical protein Q9208_007162 [Pyrenodesmia sp. 3 TL-2023]